MTQPVQSGFAFPRFWIERGIGSGQVEPNIDTYFSTLDCSAEGAGVIAGADNPFEGRVFRNFDRVLVATIPVPFTFNANSRRRNSNGNCEGVTQAVPGAWNTGEPAAVPLSVAAPLQLTPAP